MKWLEVAHHHFAWYCIVADENHNVKINIDPKLQMNPIQFAGENELEVSIFPARRGALGSYKLIFPTT